MKTAIYVSACALALLAGSGQATILIGDEEVPPVAVEVSPAPVFYPYSHAVYFGPKGQVIYAPLYPPNYGYYGSRVYGGVRPAQPGYPALAPTPLQRNIGRARYYSDK